MTNQSQTTCPTCKGSRIDIKAAWPYNQCLDCASTIPAGQAGILHLPEDEQRALFKKAAEESAKRQAEVMDPYLEQMLADLKQAELLLRHAIGNQSNPFASNGPQRMKDCQANVDRLHELIRTHKKPKQEQDV